VRIDPIRQRFAPGCLGIGEVRCPRAPRRRHAPAAPRPSPDQRRVSYRPPSRRTVLVGQMRLAHRWRQLPTPVNEQLAEPRAVAVWLFGQILLPQQCQRHAARLSSRWIAGWASRRQGAYVHCPRRPGTVALELCIVDPLRDRPPDPSHLSPPHVLGCLRLASSRRLADLAVAPPASLAPFAVQGAREDPTAPPIPKLYHPKKYAPQSEGNFAVRATHRSGLLQI
jgi:hypothetical protein